MNEQVYPNTFLTKVKNREKLVGCWSALANPISTEILGLAGFDWLLLDGEHAPNDIQTFIPQLMALKDSCSAPVVRPQENHPVVIKKLLDIGFYNLLIPFVENRSDAELAVASTRYPPEGIRGVSVGHRSNGYGTIAHYFDNINQNICVIAQIESKQGLDNIDEILSVDGINAVFVGPSDLAAALGHLGNPNHPEVQKAIQYIFDKAAEHHKPSGILAPIKEDAERYSSWGASIVAVGSDLALLKNATQNLCNSYKK